LFEKVCFVVLRSKTKGFKQQTTKQQNKRIQTKEGNKKDGHIDCAAVV